jgi:DNA end-binding protein Ku
MPRAIWRGAISFGMVSIPVKLFTATESKDIAFRQLAGEDLGRVKMLRWSPTLDREVAYDELVKGYEYAKDQYVIVDQEDFDTLPVPSKHTIQITAFVKADEIDPVYYERTYGLEPEEAGLKPFKLLLQAMEEKGLIAIGKLAIRQKEHLCALRPHEDGIVIETLYYPDELRDLDTVDLSEVEVSDEEMKMAYALIDMLEKPFDPGEYNDEYRDALMELIQAKLEGGEIVRDESAPAPQTVDLMAALKASIEATNARGDGAPSSNGASAEADDDDEAEAEKKPAAKSKKKAAAKKKPAARRKKAAKA